MSVPSSPCEAHLLSTQLLAVWLTEAVLSIQVYGQVMNPLPRFCGSCAERMRKEFVAMHGVDAPEAATTSKD